VHGQHRRGFELCTAKVSRNSPCARKPMLLLPGLCGAKPNHYGLSATAGFGQHQPLSSLVPMWHWYPPRQRSCCLQMAVNKHPPTRDSSSEALLVS